MECRVLDGLQGCQHRLFIPDSALLAVRLMVSQHIENFTAQVHGVCDPAVRGEKCAIHIEELVGAEKIVTKQGFVEEAFLDPCRGKVVSHRHTSFLRCCGLSMWSIWPHGFSLLQQVDKRPFACATVNQCDHFDHIDFFCVTAGKCDRFDHIFLQQLRNLRSAVLPAWCSCPPSGGVFRLSFSGSSPGIPYRRSCGFQGPTGKTAIKKPSQNRPALPSLFLEGHASRLCNG